MAFLYGVPTKRLNEQVKRNLERFPEDFMFQLTADEKAKVVAICDHLKKLKYSNQLPYAFTEHGALMLANHKELALKLIQFEKKCDTQFRVVFDAIRELMTPPPKPKKQIGFLK